jgi:hypothetical protein
MVRWLHREHIFKRYLDQRYKDQRYKDKPVNLIFFVGHTEPGDSLTMKSICDNDMFKSTAKSQPGKKQQRKTAKDNTIKELNKQLKSALKEQNFDKENDASKIAQSKAAGATVFSCNPLLYTSLIRTRGLKDGYDLTDSDTHDMYRTACERSQGKKLMLALQNKDKTINELDKRAKELQSFVEEDSKRAELRMEELIDAGSFLGHAARSKFELFAKPRKICDWVETAARDKFPYQFFKTKRDQGFDMIQNWVDELKDDLDVALVRERMRLFRQMDNQMDFPNVSMVVAALSAQCAGLHIHLSFRHSFKAAILNYMYSERKFDALADFSQKTAEALQLETIEVANTGLR